MGMYFSVCPGAVSSLNLLPTRAHIAVSIIIRSLHWNNVNRQQEIVSGWLLVCPYSCPGAPNTRGT